MLPHNHSTLLTFGTYNFGTSDWKRLFLTWHVRFIVSHYFEEFSVIHLQPIVAVKLYSMPLATRLIGRWTGIFQFPNCQPAYTTWNAKLGVELLAFYVLHELHSESHRRSKAGTLPTSCNEPPKHSSTNKSYNFAAEASVDQHRRS